MSISLFILSSCEKELYDDAIKNDARIKSVKNTTLKELLKNPNFNDVFSKVKSKTQQLKNTSARTALEDQYNFTILPADVKVIETTDGRTSYTFQIERNTPTLDFFENLVIQLHESGDLDALIMKYTPTSLDIHDFEYTKEYTPLIQSGRVLMLSNGCIMVTYTTCCDLVPGNAMFSSPHLVTEECNDSNYYQINSYISCPIFDNEGGGPAPTNNNDGDGFSGTGGSVITNPNTPKNLASKKFIKNLLDPQNPNENRANCYNQSTPDFKQELANFIDTYSLEMTADGDLINTNGENSVEQFANAAIDAQCSGAEVDFPNRVIIDSTFVNNQKAMCIYNKLKTSPKFKEMFLSMFEENTRPSVTLKLADLPGNSDFGLVGTTETIDGINNIIEIDTDLIDNGNNMQIANTILHEFVHAYLNVKLASPEIGASIPNLNNMELTDCINQYYNGFNNDQNQHDFIYNNFIPTMATILSEIKNSLVDNITNNLFNFVYINTASGSSLWNWSDYYQIQPLDGLQSCQFFISEIATIGSNGMPTSIVNFTKWQKYNEYRLKSKENLNNNCIN